MTNNYITKSEFQQLEDRVANVERILNGQEIKELEEKERHQYNEIRLVEEDQKYERALEIVLKSGLVRHLDNKVLLVNGIAIRQLEQEGIPYEKITEKPYKRRSYLVVILDRDERVRALSAFEEHGVFGPIDTSDYKGQMVFNISAKHYDVLKKERIKFEEVD